MTTIDSTLLEAAINILGGEDASDDEIEASMLELARDPMVARRLIDWLPEIFGYVLIAHMGEVNIARTFSARTASGKWKSIPMSAEPIFVLGLRIAQDAYHSSWTEGHKRIAYRSAVLRSVSDLLDKGGSLDGATTSGPALIGIPAEVYRSKLPLLRRILW